MSELWAGVIGALVASGVVILHVEWQAWRTKRNQTNAVRRMLWIEIERNLELASDLRRYIMHKNLDPISNERLPSDVL